MQRSNVGGHRLRSAGQQLVGQLSCGHGFVEAHPASVPGLQFTPWQARLDLDDPVPEKSQRFGVQVGGGLEVKTDLEPARSGVVPAFEVGLGPPVVQFQEAPPAVLAEKLAGHPLSTGQKEAASQSFHWTMQLHLPWRLLASVAAVLVTASVITALVSGRYALSGGPIRAVREDW